MSKAKKPAQQARVFVPLRKVDEENRLVHGTITQEILDKAGETMDYASSKPHFEKWSGDIEAATGGLSKGNVRVMHGMTAAGKLTDISFDDAAQTIDVCAKIVDDNEWEKVLEGVYTGFSVGGSYAKKWNETVDGATVKKFTAIPNEVSIVDNPCVPSATFQFAKADGSVEAVMFKVAAEALVEEAEAADEARIEASEAMKASPPASAQPSNDAVVAKATDMAKVAGDGTTWMDHVTAARDELLKAAPNGTAQKETEEGGDPKPEEADDAEEVEDDTTDGKTGDKEAGTDDDKVEKTTPAGVKQVWAASDGKTFEKKADAEAHDETLAKAEVVEDETDPAVKLKKAMAGAVSAIEAAEAGTPLVEQAEPTVFTDLDRMHKAFIELDQPRDADGAPKLEKGMYTVRRFADVLGDVANLARTIKAEGVLEQDGGSDESVSDTLKASLSSFGDSFLTYAKEQVAELLAGVDTDLSPVSCYDYYYRAAQADPENTLAKDCADLIDSVKDDIPVVQETLAKAWGGTVGGEGDLQKRFDTLSGKYDALEKVAGEAVEQVGGLVKRIKVIEDTPLPRAPSGSLISKEGDNFFGKAASHEDKLGVLKTLLDEHGADGVATLMIKASQQTGGHQMTLTGR